MPERRLVEAGKIPMVNHQNRSCPEGRKHEERMKAVEEGAVEGDER